jgi:3-oxoacyl-[acyl-carrier-protein] synthase-1
MTGAPLAILRTGLVTCVGLSAPAACAAIRAKISNPAQSRSRDSAGEWIMTCPVPVEEPRETPARLARMAAMAIEESLEDVPRGQWQQVPLLLCVAEPQRPGRAMEPDAALLGAIEGGLGARFAPHSAVIALGRAGIAHAVRRARELIHEHGAPLAVIAGADSLLTPPQLAAFDRAERLLTPANPDGFVPGEAAGAAVVGHPGAAPQLLVKGVGGALERATIDSEEPQRAEGLVQAIRAALAEAQCGLHDLDFRIADLSGERYYFKEAALAVARLLRRGKEDFDLWHPAECTGEVGAAAGPVALAVAHAACRKGYAPGPNILAHFSSDAGERAALVLGYGG